MGIAHASLLPPDNLRTRRGASTRAQADAGADVGACDFALFDDARVRVVRIGCPGGALSGFVTGLAEDLAAFERLERYLRFHAAFRARDVVLRALGAGAWCPLAGGAFAVAARGPFGLPARRPRTRLGRPRSPGRPFAPRLGLRAPVPTVEASAIAGRPAGATSRVASTAVPTARRASTRTPAAGKTAAAARASAEPAAAWARTPAETRAAARRSVATKAAASPRASAIALAVLRAPRLAARLAPLGWRGQAPLGVKLLLGLTKQKRAAALGARDLLVAHRGLSGDEGDAPVVGTGG
jgi:hypothetical protein